MLETENRPVVARGWEGRRGVAGNGWRESGGDGMLRALAGPGRVSVCAAGSWDAALQMQAHPWLSVVPPQHM